MDEIATRRADDQGVIAAMTGIGATSAADACRHRALPPAIQAQLPTLLERGIVREGRPGYFYLYLRQGADSARRRLTLRRVLFAVGFWIVMILLPFVFIYILGR